jgi:hypothetical protein
MEGIRLVKNILNSNLDIKKNSIDIKRWFDDFQTDIRTLRMKRPQLKTQDKKEWARISRSLESISSDVMP